MVIRTAYDLIVTKGLTTGEAADELDRLAADQARGDLEAFPGITSHIRHSATRRKLGNIAFPQD